MGRISIAGVLRLRAMKPSVSDRSAKRFTQDDVFVGVLTENIQNKLALMGQRRGLDLKGRLDIGRPLILRRLWIPESRSAPLPKALFMCATTQAMLFLVRHLESGLDLT
jgi:hypothetical protein